MKHNRVSSPTVPFVGKLNNPSFTQFNPLINGSAPRPARMSSPLDPPNSGKRRRNINNERDEATDKGFSSIPSGR